jgi:two-component system NarL family sensor kinase
MKVKFIIAFLFFLAPHLQCQTVTQRVEKEINQYAFHLETNPQAALHHINEAYRISVAANNDSLIARSLCNLGYYYFSRNNIEQSKRHYFKAIAYSRKVKYGKILCYSFNQLGIIAAQGDEFGASLKWYLAALKIADTGGLPEIKSKVLLNLGNLYMIRKDTLKGLDYYRQNVANAKQHALNKDLAQGYITIAIVYSASDKAKTLKFYYDALNIAQKSSDFATAFNIHSNLSNFYLSNPSPGDIEKARWHIEQAAKIQQALEDKTLLFFVYFNFGGYHLTKKQYDSALVYYNKALSLNPKDVTSDQKLNLYKCIAEVYTARNDYKNAYFFQEQYRNLNDSIFNINKNIAFNEIETKYEVEKKNLKIDLLSKEKTIERTNKQIVIFVGITAVIPLLFLTLFYRNKNKLQKVINEKEQELFLQEKIKLENEQEIERVLGILEGQATERDRIASEIHDGIGGELAGIKLYLSKVNTTLNNDNITLVIGQLTGLFQELRNISHNLSSNFLKDKDFYTVIADLKKEYENRNAFAVELVIFPEDAFADLPETLRHQVYRIIQELLANVSKHAKADKVDLSITRHDDFLNLIVEDNGVGFADTGASGIGLKNIRDRLKSLGGTITIESQPNKGSSIIIDIPCKP